MDLSKVPTYHAGIAQSKAHRSLSWLVTGWLKKHDVTMMQWFILGLVYDSGVKGIRITDIALQLDTTKAFVTKNINILEDKKLVVRSVDADDSRSRIVKLTAGINIRVDEIEQKLRSDMRLSIYKHIKPQELGVYIKVQSQLARLGER